MSQTLNELISQAILPDEAPPAPESPSQEEVAGGDIGDVEKIASVLEFLGRRGIANLVALEKVAMATCPKCGSKCKSCKGKTCGCCKHMPKEPMSKGAMATDTNAGKKPGDGREVDLSATALADHHRSLSGNEAAISFDKKEKSKSVDAALSKALQARAFADPCLKQDLQHSGTDKNIHTKSAHDLQAVRAELAARVAERGHNA